jgi:hypothetical protein
MKKKNQATIKALKARQRELKQILAMNGLTTEQAREYFENHYQIFQLMGRVS